MRHRVPQWYRDAKLGIMVHWGVPTIPAYAPVEHGGVTDILRDHDWRFYFENNPHAGWYLNSLRIPGSPAAVYHRRHFGRHSSYERLARRFNEGLERWNPGEWAELFRDAGARYVVMVGKHHDGFLMWPSAERPPGENFVATRDVLGELGEAVRGQGLKYGLYYSGLLDWTVQGSAIRDYPDLLLAETPPEYERYAKAHFHELMERYSPDLLWNDIGLPSGISRRELFAAYRKAVPEGVLNDRWRRTGIAARRILATRVGRYLLSRATRRAILEGRAYGGNGDVATVEYAAGTALRHKPWELVRGLGRSYCYNAAEPAGNYLSGVELIHLLVDVVSRNGNLLLNVAPDSDGQISRPQRDALGTLSAWLRDHGEAIYETRPWLRSGTSTSDGIPVRFTTRANALYAIVLGRPRMLALSLGSIDLDRVPRPRAGRDRDRFVVRILGTDRPAEWRTENGAVVVDIPGSFVPGDAMVVKLAWEGPAEEPASGFYTDII
ncbi:MAG: alpha-L-fucosidase [Spirochaetota bacterium]